MSKKNNKNKKQSGSSNTKGQMEQQTMTGQMENAQDEAKKNDKEAPEKQDDKMAKLKEELQKEKDKYLRLFAEFENYKKRTTKERIELFSTANKELMTALLPVIDDFERGLNEIDKAGDKVLLDGMKLIYSKLKNTLEQKGLKQIEVKKGDVFDADLHEAITQIPAPEEDLKGKIIDVVEKGYMLGETIVRYPKVVTGS